MRSRPRFSAADSLRGIREQESRRGRYYGEVVDSVPVVRESECEAEFAAGPDIPAESESDSDEGNVEDGFERSVGDQLLKMLHDYMPRARNKSCVVREAQLFTDAGNIYVDKVTLDTGANAGNYIGSGAVSRMTGAVKKPCSHTVRLGDGVTHMAVTETIELQVAMFDDNGCMCSPILTKFYVVESLGEDVIIGLHDICGGFYEYFLKVLKAGAVKSGKSLKNTERLLEEFGIITERFEDELAERFPRMERLKKLCRLAREKVSSYRKMKTRVLQDRGKVEVYEARKGIGEEPGSCLSYIYSVKEGAVFEDDRVEMVLRLMDVMVGNPLEAGKEMGPWQKPKEKCPEEEATPAPTVLSEDVLRFMEMGVEAAREEYLELIETHVSEKMQKMCPKVMDLLATSMACEIFTPTHWNGMDVPKATLEIVGDLPDRLCTKARPIRKALYEHAKKEFLRLRTYFFVESSSSIASPLVIAPKATAPFIRFCGDYRAVNKFIRIPQQPIPIVKHELTKASGFGVYVDLDMANSFHQIPLDEEFSNMLSVTTP